jgi:membrane protease YdiL (CAAX protease family)
MMESELDTALMGETSQSSAEFRGAQAAMVRPARVLTRGLVLYALVVIAALLFNRGTSSMAALFLLACLALPLLGGTLTSLQQTLVIRRSGWAMTAVLSLLLAIVPYGMLLVAVKGYLRAMLLHPTLVETTHFLVRRAPLLLTLALAEEFFFRGYLQETVFRVHWGTRSWGLVTRKNLAASLLFGVAHGVSALSPLGLLKVFSGLVLGWLVERSDGSIWPAVVLHALSNLAIAWFALLIGLNGPWL